jgi:hypothetical protein
MVVVNAGRRSEKMSSQFQPNHCVALISGITLHLGTEARDYGHGKLPVRQGSGHLYMRRGAYLLPPHQAPGFALPLYIYSISNCLHQTLA